MKKILTFLALLLLLPFATANVEITEIMYAPTQVASDTDGEWIEIHNSGQEAVDITEWKLDDYNFDDAIIKPGEYIVIARELIDGTDADLESYESYWGNGDGIWNDGNYVALDGYFSLTEEDQIVLTNELGEVVDSVNYSSSMGGLEGHTLEKINGEWVDGFLDGTPGYSSAEAPVIGENDVLVEININNIEPLIKNLYIEGDELSSEGVQITPSFEGNKTIVVTAIVEDLNSDEVVLIGDIEGKKFVLEKVSEINNVTYLYNGTFEMSPSDLAKIYTVSVVANDSYLTSTKNVDFEYISMVSTVLETSNIQFEGNPGENSETVEISVKNTGNVPLNLELSSTELRSRTGILGIENLEMDDGTWKTLGLVGSNVLPQQNINIPVRIKIPVGVKADKYTGKISVKAII